MSIIISAVEFNKTFYIASDRRAIRRDVVSDDYQKIYTIRPSIFFAMTGIAEVGLEFLQHIRKHAGHSVGDLLVEANRIFTPTSVTCTNMIAGQNEYHEFFIWQKNNRGETNIADIGNNNIAFSIGANDNIPGFAAHFEGLILSGIPVRDAIVRTIAYASRMDPSISQVYDIFTLGPYHKT